MYATDKVSLNEPRNNTRIFKKLPVVMEAKGSSYGRQKLLDPILSKLNPANVPTTC
jgi:hypothetical protein